VTDDESDSPEHDRIENKTGLYNIGVDPSADEAIALAEAEAIEVTNRLELGTFRTVVSGIYREDRAEWLCDHPDIRYVQREGHNRPADE